MWLKRLYLRWTDRVFTGQPPQPTAARRRGPRPSLEQLEDRTVPSVTTGANIEMPTGIPSDAPAVAATVLDGADSADVQRDLARARQATAKYHDLDAALADGFVNTGLPCIEGQGYHYINFSRIGTLDVESPQLLVYAPDGQLVAVEWLIPASLTGGVPPTLFGETFHGPIPGDFFILHAWVWRANPDGMFADTHPDIHCEDLAGVEEHSAGTPHMRMHGSGIDWLSAWDALDSQSSRKKQR
jgi:hypothetical protein